ncbi:MAG: hypothetical protein EXR58_05705 [Chloroflexi bacterium]|nr:hypothetical protein [Chloroflexota bacterium]
MRIRLLLVLAVSSVAVALLPMSPGGTNTLSPNAAAAQVRQQDQPADPDADDVRERQEYFHNQRAAPADEIPAGALLRARQQLDTRLQARAIPIAPQGRPGAAVGGQSVVESGLDRHRPQADWSGSERLWHWNAAQLRTGDVRRGGGRQHRLYRRSRRWSVEDHRRGHDVDPTH